MKIKRRRSIVQSTLSALMISIVGCDLDSSGSSSNNVDDESIIIESLVEQEFLDEGDSRCGLGGILVKSGPDLDQNGHLTDNEVNMSNVVCDASPIEILDPSLVAEGKVIFRHDTFGDEKFWTDQLKMHEVIETAVSPEVALSVGIKVDSEVLPEGILETVDLTDPKTTVALIALDAVVGLKGEVEEVDGEQHLKSVGVTCAFCHSTVDDSLAPGIGKRLDGWPNRDLDPGLIISLSPALQDPETQETLRSWGPGKYDAYWNHDGISNPAVIPPAYGFNGVHVSTFTGEGDISYWNAYVAVTQMGGVGSFSDPNLGINIENDPDLVTPKLAALKAYQFSLDAPRPSLASYDPVAAGRGKKVFENEGQCVQCHTGPFFTDANTRLHEPFEVGADPLLAQRSTTGKYRTTPLKGVSFHPPYFHDGSAENLSEVVQHYDGYLGLGLDDQQKSDLVEYLRSL